jgi:glutamate racemase
MKRNMIGIFDSGLGGLTVAKEIMKQLPDYRVVYFGDTARTPYGTKSPGLIKKYSLENANFLLNKGAEVIVVACNTASAHAVDNLRRSVSVPVFEVVTPAVQQAVDQTQGSIGVIGTRSTISSGVYESKIGELAPDIRVNSASCPLFVPLVEEGWSDRPETGTIAKQYLRPLRLSHVDTLILGCTHYPFLRSAIREAIGESVNLIDPAAAVTAQLMSYLAKHPKLDNRLHSSNQHVFYVSDRTEHFACLAQKWLESTVDVHAVEAEKSAV